MTQRNAWNSPLDWSQKPFTWHYAQPKEYHYSLDSIEFIWRLTQEIQLCGSLPADARILDLCAGCGVLGFELSYWFPHLSRVDFIEIQTEFNEHFYENLRRTNATDKNFRFLNMNFSSVPDQPAFFKHYDLIVCNPPYFRSDTGILGHSRMRNRCHFLLDANFESLCASIRWSLAPQGAAYVLLRDLSAQGVQQFAEMQACFGASEFEVEQVGVVRGTPVIRILAKP